MAAGLMRAKHVLHCRLIGKRIARSRATVRAETLRYVANERRVSADDIWPGSLSILLTFWNLSTMLTNMMRPVEDLVWQVRRLFQELAQAAEGALAPLGVTTAERALLEFLAREQAPISLSEIARKRSLSRQHIHQTLSRLDPRWVDRAGDPGDARAVVLTLSKEGRALWKRIRAVDAVLLGEIEKRLDERKVRAATATLQKVRDALESMQEET